MAGSRRKGDAHYGLKQVMRGDQKEGLWRQWGGITDLVYVESKRSNIASSQRPGMTFSFDDEIIFAPFITSCTGLFVGRAS